MITLEASTLPLVPAAGMLRLNAGRLDTADLAGTSDTLKAWRDLTDTSTSISYSIGAEPDPISPFPDAGTLTATFRNPDAWPDLLPGDLIRVKDQTGAYPHTWKVSDLADVPGKDGVTLRTVTAADSTARLAATPATGMAACLTTLTAISRISALSGVAVDVSPWSTMLTDETMSYADGISCADYLDRLCIPCGAVWFEDPDGVIRFLPLAQRVPSATTVTDTAAPSYYAVEISNSTSTITNQLTMDLTAGAGSAQVSYTQTASVARYGVRGRSLAGIAGGTGIAEGSNPLGEWWPAMTANEAQPFRWLWSVADNAGTRETLAAVTTDQLPALVLGYPLAVTRAGVTHHARIIGQQATITPTQAAPGWAWTVTHLLIPRTPSD